MSVRPNRPFFPPEDIEGIKEKVGEILESGELSNGKYVKKLEERFAAQVHSRYAIAVSSGTAALEIIYRWIDREYGPCYAYVPTNTFVATVNAAYYAGLHPILTDIGYDLCMSRERLENRMTQLCMDWLAMPEMNSCVTVVHIGGLISPEIVGIKGLCKERDIPLVEDCAHAHGSTFEGVPAGMFGVAGAYSFYPTKVMTCGEGGMIVTDKRGLDDFARSVRDQGRSRNQGEVNINYGNNWRMSEVHAVLGLYQLKRLDEFIGHRERIAKVYDSHQSRWEPLITPLNIPGGARSSYYKYVRFLHPTIHREVLKRDLKSLGISLPGEVYAVPLHQQPLSWHSQPAFTGHVANQVCAQHICLPIHAAMSEADADTVANGITHVLRSERK